MNEFDIIQNFFMQQDVNRADVILGIGDDGAILEVPAKQELVITTDTMVAGVHFLQDTSAFDLGFKALAVNLSDLAAMGATPAWFTAALTLDDSNKIWLSEFSRGLFELARRFGIQLIGGDLTQGPLTITLTAHGFVPKNQALRRDHAKPGDLIFVTNTLGDAALGLLFLNKKISVREEFRDFILMRLHRPEPQIHIGEKLRGKAHAAIDLSDGLAADLGHILKNSQVGATVYVDRLPASAALRESTSSDLAIELALTGGDDYELCFTASPEVKNFDFNCTCIGKITAKLGLDLQHDDGRKYQGVIAGYQHF